MILFKDTFRIDTSKKKKKKIDYKDAVEMGNLRDQVQSETMSLPRDNKNEPKKRIGVEMPPDYDGSKPFAEGLFIYLFIYLFYNS